MNGCAIIHAVNDRLGLKNGFLFENCLSFNFEIEITKFHQKSSTKSILLRTEHIHINDHMSILNWWFLSYVLDMGSYHDRQTWKVELEHTPNGKCDQNKQSLIMQLIITKKQHMAIEPNHDMMMATTSKNV